MIFQVLFIKDLSFEHFILDDFTTNWIVQVVFLWIFFISNRFLVYILYFKNFLDRPQSIKIANWYNKFVLIISDLKFDVETKFLFLWSIAEIDLDMLEKKEPSMTLEKLKNHKFLFNLKMKAHMKIIFFHKCFKSCYGYFVWDFQSKLDLKKHRDTKITFCYTCINM